MATLGLDANWLRGRECRALEPGLGPSAFAGIDAPGEAAVDPRALVGALATACENAGAEIATGVAVTDAIAEGESIRGVVTADGAEHRAAATVLAAGAWSAADWLPAEARPPVRPVKGQIITLCGAPGAAPLTRIVATERAYMVPRADGRLIVGATVEELGFDTRVTAGGVLELLREAYRAVPDVAELELERASAGLRPGTPDNAPLVGRSPVPGLLWATGHHRNGILLAPLTAAGITALLVGDDALAELDPAAPGRLAEVRA